mgnify:FL=1
MKGSELKKLRESSGISQKELAKHLGYFVGDKPNRSMISRFELGYAKINPRIERLCKDFIRQRQENTEQWEKVI